MSDTFQPYCNMRITSSRTRVKYCIWWLSDELITTYHHRGCQSELLYNRYWRLLFTVLFGSRNEWHADIMMGLQYTRRLGTSVAVGCMLRYDTIRDAILTCARKPTRVSLIYRTETTTKKCKTEKLKSKNGYAHK